MKPSDCHTEHVYVGALIDERYRLLDFIGVGGMACVYRAQEDDTPHDYALKFLKMEYRKEDFLIRFFEQEASNMRDLAHPNIVRFYRFVNSENYSYIVMDYIDGYALSDIVKRMRQRHENIPLDEVVRIMVQVARALDAIHRDGFVHRDVKPSNVLIRKRDGMAFLGDLGITTSTRTEMRGAGTAAYMAPEQANQGIADQRTDIYAYGVLLFELLCRHRPYRVRTGLRGKDAEQDLIKKHSTAPIPNITDYREDLPPAMNDIMQRALAKRPADRYDSIMALARDIHVVLSPHLSADLQEFTQINHLSGASMLNQVAAMETRPPRPKLNTNWAIGGVILLAVVLLGGLLVAASGILAPDATPTPAAILRNATESRPTQTPTRVSTATTLAVGGGIMTGEVGPSYTPSPTLAQTHTPTTRPSATPNPIERQPVFTFLSGVNALAVPDDLADLRIAPADTPLRYLRVGDVDGFRVDLDATATEGINRYGVVFRLQDAENYLRLSISPEREDWRIEEVIDGLPTILRAGSITGDGDPFAPLTLTGRGNFFQFELGDTRAEQVNGRWQGGSLGLWVESETGATLMLDELSVSIVGPEAVRAAQASPTPATGYGDALRFLRANVDSLIATNDVITSTINCPAFIQTYDALEQHFNNPNATARNLARRLVNAGEPIYSRCQARSPDAPLSFISAPDDYLDWEEVLRDVANTLRAET